MKKLLHFLKSHLTNKGSSWVCGLLFLLISTTAQQSKAQVYYLTTDNDVSTKSTYDAIKTIGYTGSGGSTISTGIANSGTLINLDLTNNRIFYYEALAASKSIKIANATTGTIINTITVPYNVTDMKYDVSTNYIYFATTNNGITLGVEDAFYKVRPTDSSPTLLASSVSTSISQIALDVPNNRAFLFETVPANRGIKIFNLSSNTITASITPQSGSCTGMDYDPIDGTIYYLTSDGSALNTGVTDAINKIQPDGSNSVVVKSGVTGSPVCMGLDAGNKRIYIYEGATASRAIKSVDLNTGNVTMVLDLSGQPTGNTGVGLVSVKSIALPLRAVLTTSNASSISSASATLGGNISRSDINVTARGVIYSSSNVTPTIGGSGVTQVTNGSGTGAFSGSVTGLSAITTYYVRAYAFSDAGTAYGTVTSFATTSNDANLAGLSISAGTLTPAFSAGTTSYTASVPNATSSITITPTRNQANATIQVNGTAVTSGSASGSINLNLGDNVITTTVTAQDGTSNKTYTLTVNRPKVSQTISFGPLQTKNFGAFDFDPGAVASSGLTVSYTSDNTSVATIVNGAIHIVGAGTANITASQGGNANTAEAASVIQVLTVNKRSQTITFNALPSKTYGNADFAPGATTNTGLTVTYSSDNLAVATIVNNQIHIVAPGTAFITASQAGDANRAAAVNVVQNFSVDKATVTVTANSQTKVYGDNEPVFTYTSTGVVGSDVPTGTLSRNTTGANNNIVGSFPITQGTLSYGDNYNLVYIGANLTITKRAITFKVVNRNKVYGDAEPYLNSFSITSGSFAPNLTLGTTGAFARDAGENVGTYVIGGIGIKLIVGTDNTSANANYDITIIPGTFTITPKPLTVTANAQTKTFGDADPALTYIPNGLVGSDAFTGSLGREAGESGGTYAITQGTLSISSNYTLSFVGNNLTIGKKTINVTANAQSKTFGQSDPALTYTSDPLAAGDNFTGALTRAAGENAGDYVISQGSLAVNTTNYLLNFTGANFTIGKKQIAIEANALSKFYGESDPALTYVITSGTLESGDNFTGELTRSVGENPGTYSISQGTLALTNNYNIAYTAANLTISKRQIDVYANAQSSQFGDPEAAITYTYTGTLANADTFTGKLGREPGTSTGTYATTLGTLALTNPANYALVFHSSAYNVTAREIIAKSPFTLKVYGDADPALTYNIVSGSLLGSTQISGSLTRDAGENSGDYTIKQGTLTIADPNYSFVYQGGTFEIDRAPLTIKADDKTKLVNAPNPTFTYTITGFKNGDTEAAFSNPVMFFNLPLSSAPVGTYDIYVADTYSPNYNITAQSGILTVRALATNANLTALTINRGTLTPNFDGNTTEYDVTLPAGVNSIEVTPTVADAAASVTVNYSAVTSGQPATVALYAGDNIVPVIVTAEDNVSTKVYNINIKTPLSSNAKLAGIYISNGGTTLNPEFDANVHTYTMDVPNATTSVRISPFQSSQYAMIKINGEPYEGNFSPYLIAGANIFEITVLAQDRNISETYTVTINRASSANNNLSNLTVSNYNLAPVFDSETLNYTTSVPSNVSSIEVSGIVADTTAKYTVNGNTPLAYQPYAVTLNTGGNVITVEVIAQNGETKDYTITVNKLSNNAFASFKLNPTSTFKAIKGTALENYGTSVAADVSSITVTPTAQSTGAIITINGTTIASGTASAPIALAVGATTINVVVTSQDSTTIRSYSLTINRLGSSNAYAALAVSPYATLTRTTGSGSENYTTSVDPATTSVTLTPTAQDANAIVKVNGTIVTSGDASLPVALNMGATLINVEVKAQDGATIRKYTVTVNRTGSSNAQVSLKLNPTSTFARISGPSAENFSTSVAADVSTVSLTPTAQDAGAVIKINGAAVASGMPSNPISLTGASTLIHVAVTAADGLTTRSYSVTVKKTGSSNAYATFALTPSATLTRTNGSAAENYTTSVVVEQNAITFTPTAQDVNATISVNGTTIASGSPFPVSLNAVSTTINMVVTAEDGLTTRTYEVVVSRIGSSNAQLALSLTPAATFTRVTGNANENFVTSVNPLTSSVTLTPTALAAGALIKVNGATVASGTPSAPISLSAASTIINVDVTAQDGITTRSYSVTVNKTGSSNAFATLRLSPSSVFVRTTGSATENFTTQAAAGVNRVTLTTTTQDAASIVSVNGNVVASGSASQPIALTGPSTFINVVVVAQNGATVRTYSVEVTRSAVETMASVKDNAGLFYAKNANSNLNTAQDIVVHQGVSPNGDGFNDFLVIEGLSAATTNKLSIMNTSGTLVFEMKDYGKDGARVFDGHAKNGTLLKPGTYYYTLEYKEGDKDKRKTGYIILKF